MISQESFQLLGVTTFTFFSKNVLSRYYTQNMDVLRVDKYQIQGDSYNIIIMGSYGILSMIIPTADLPNLVSSYKYHDKDFPRVTGLVKC